jgi:periplasmic protein TonB
MKTVLLYRPRRRWLTWTAFGCAAAIHVGAIVIAKGRSDNIAMKDFKPAEVDLEVVDKEPEPMPPEETVMPPPSEQASRDDDAFPEENPTPSLARPRKKIVTAPVVRVAARGAVAQFGSVKALVMYGRRPEYPYDARRQRITGSGIALLTVAPAVGNVIGVRIVQSSGSVILDNATLDALRRWRFKPGSVSSVQVPFTYTLSGASY